MKLQTSLEFLLVLSAISALCLLVVVFYGSDAKLYSANDFLSNNTIAFQSPIASGTNDNGIFTYVNQTSIIGKENAIIMVLYGCPDGYANITLSSNTSSLLETYIPEIDFYNSAAITDYFEPTQPGITAILVSYSIWCYGSNQNGLYHISSFSKNATNPDGSQPIQYSSASAYISNRNESIVYDNFSVQDVYSLGQSSHCTDNNFFGDPLPPSVQCGSSDAWDYSVFSSSCYTNNQGQTATYCIYPDQTGYSIKTINEAGYHYAYNFSLIIYNGTNMYTSQINSTYSQFPVYLGVAKVGVANVTSVYAQPYSPAFAILSNSTSSLSINSTSESQYQEASTSAFSTFSFYNSTEVDTSTQSAIDQQVSAFNKISAELLASGAKGIQGCTIDTNYLTCTPIYPFEYQINITLIKDPIPNQTIDAEGSQIHIRG